MNTRKMIVYMLVAVMLVGILTGCGKQNDTPTTPGLSGTLPAQATEPSKGTEPSQATEPSQNTATVPETNPTDVTEATIVVSTCSHVTQNKWEVEKFSTCTTEGLRTKRCTQCKEIAESEVIPVRDHDPGTWKVDRASTCSVEGLQHQECQQCKEIIVYINMEKKAHTPDATGEKCKVCNQAIPKA